MKEISYYSDSFHGLGVKLGEQQEVEYNIRKVGKSSNCRERGQSMAIRISNNFKKVMIKLKLQIKLYNNLKCGSLKYPNTLDFENVKDQEAPLWKDQMNNMSEVADVQNSIKRHCIELLSTIVRCKEEQGLIEEEMSSFIAWLLNEYNHLNDLVKQSVLTSAKKSVVIKEAMIIETDLNMLNTLF
ncbi:unnamed protein product [Mytilus coruscus]|uniref:Uncharacterized protein n=1 Tax=Mytilus coruscus TaxID=42192 RepID=A0A6J8CZZ7_MYTCO|nr:unnamed protein product [Mytilus coruscus]